MLRVGPNTGTPVTLGPLIWDYWNTGGVSGINCSPSCPNIFSPPSTQIGDLLIIIYQGYQSTSPTISSVSGDGTWVAGGECHSTSTTHTLTTDMAHTLTATSTGAQPLSVTLSANDNDAEFTVLRWAGGSGIYALDSAGCKTTSNPSASATDTTTSITTTGTADLIVSGGIVSHDFLANAAVTNVAGSGWTSPLPYISFYNAGPWFFNQSVAAGTYQASAVDDGSISENWTNSTLAFTGMTAAPCDNTPDVAFSWSNGTNTTAVTPGLLDGSTQGQSLQGYPGGTAWTISSSPSALVYSTTVSQSMPATECLGSLNGGSMVLDYPTATSPPQQIDFTPAVHANTNKWSFAHWIYVTTPNTDTNSTFSLGTLTAATGGNYVDVAIVFSNGTAPHAECEIDGNGLNDMGAISNNGFYWIATLYDDTAPGTSQMKCEIRDTSGTVLGSYAHAGLTGGHPLGFAIFGPSGAEAYTSGYHVYTGKGMLSTSGVWPLKASPSWP